MKSSKAILCIALMHVALASQAKAVLVDFDLVLTNLDSNSAALDVVVNYQADSVDAGLVFLALDVGGSSDNLTSNGTDFSRFSFTPGTPLTGWNPVGIDTDFTVTSSNVSYDTFDINSALAGGQHTIGVLTVDLAGLAGQLVNVGLILPNQSFFGTDAGQESPVGDPQSFELLSLEDAVTVDSARFDVPQGQSTSDIPEPATAALGLMGLSLVGIRRRRAA